MKFGIFYELQLPRPWVAGDELRLYQNALSQMELADRLGYDHAWVVEHHFLEEYSHSPSPESFLAAASQRTKNIRLGHGILQLTTNHPARVAERVAVLDLLSNGRCEFGMGESASITELTPFGRDMETKKEVFEEAVQAIFPMFKDAGSEHHGKYFDIPLRNVVPKPGAEAASAVVDGLLAAADHRTCRPSRLWRARLPVRQRGRRARLGARLLQRHDQASRKARRLRDQPEHGVGVVLHVREDG
ncbi:LLM class flavin-dependent oxidoreductase [Bradyrhizobium sp. LM2.9]